MRSSWQVALEIMRSSWHVALGISVEMLCALERVHPSDVFYSSALQLYSALQLNLKKSPWTGCVNAGRKASALQYGLAILIFVLQAIVGRIALELLHHG